MQPGEYGMSITRRWLLVPAFLTCLSGGVLPGLAAEARPARASSEERGNAYYELMAARLAAREGGTLEAIERLRRACSLDPGSAPLHAEGAAMMLLLGERDEAEALATRALELEPDDPRATRVLADIAAARAVDTDMAPVNRDEAIRLYDRLATDPAVADEVLGVLANLKLHAGDNRGAVDAARRFAERRPGDEQATTLLSRSLVRDGQPQEALDALFDHLISYPDSEELVLQVSDLARKTDDWDRIEEFCGRLTEARPTQFLPRGLRGQALLRLGQLEEATAELERAVGLAPQEPGPAVRMFLLVTQSHLLTAYEELGRLADAVEVARLLAREFPDNSAVLTILGDVLAQQDDFAGAAKAYDTAIGEVPGADEQARELRDDLRRRLANVHLRAHRPDRAARVLEGLEHPLDPRSIEARVTAALRTGRYGHAAELASELRHAGRPGLALLVEGEVALGRGRERRARQRFAASLEILGHEARPRIARAWRKAGRPAQAEAVLRAWVEAEPGNATAWFRLGSDLDERRQHAAGDAALREAIRLDPRHAGALNVLGYSMVERGASLEEARAFLERAVALDPWNASFLDSLGWADFKLGRYEGAREALERAARQVPFDPTVLEHLGDVCAAQGDTARAIEIWQRALSIRPLNPIVREKLARSRGERQLHSRRTREP